MKVLLFGGSLSLDASVRRMVGGEAKIDPLTADQTDADLVVVEEASMTPRLLERIRKQLGAVPVLVIGDETRLLRIEPLPDNLARLKYRDVMERHGRTLLPEYLAALLRAHAGNVTKAALAAGVERESLHRLMRRYEIDARSYRGPHD